MAKNLLLWVGIAALLVMVFHNVSGQEMRSDIEYSQFLASVESGQVKEITVSDNLISGKYNDGTVFQTIRPSIMDLDLMPMLVAADVQIQGKEPERQGFLTQLFLAILPILLILAIFLFFMRQMQGGGRGGGGGPMSFGKSKARLLGEDQIKTTFADVAGCEESKEDVKEIVDFLKDPGKYQQLGGKIPRGVLMVGPPGTGKTLLAKAIAGEAKVPFFSISGSDFVEMFVGVGASRVRDMFEQAKKHAPCIIFIDEIDAVGRSRGAGLGGGHDEREQTLNQLLVEMDGFSQNDGVIVIAATNRPDVLDNALLRPGRFDRQVTVGLPDVRGREQILKVHMRNVPIDDDVKAALLARGTPGFSGAELANLVNEAALFTARVGKRLVGMNEFELAKDKIMMGAERKSMVMSEDEKELTAWHESGHAIVGYLMPGGDPLHKVTIIPRGRALGVTFFLPEEDRISTTREWMDARLAVAFGGRIAEEMLRGPSGVTTGASQDIQMATSLARNMVTKWGMSESMGPVLYEEDEGEVFLGKSVSQRKNISERTADNIDKEVRVIIDQGYAKAESLLEEHKDKLETMAKVLIQYETIDIDQVNDIMNGRTPKPPKDWIDDDNDADSGQSSESDTVKKTVPKEGGSIGGPAGQR